MVQRCKSLHQLWQSYFRAQWVRCIRFVLILLIGMMFGHRDAFAFSVELSDGWTIEHGSNLPVQSELAGSIQKFVPSIGSEATVRYSRDFIIEGFETGKSVFLILPTNWSNLKIEVNGFQLLDEMSGSGALGRIFENRIVSIPNRVLLARNHIVIIAEGHALRSGFRSSDALITDERSIVAKVRVRNILFNDVHIAFIVLALVIGLIGLRLNSMNGSEISAVRALALTGLGLIPHHLLATDFYRILGAGESWPFKFQMLCQLAAWVNFVLFINRFAPIKSAKIDKLKEFWLRYPWRWWVLAGIAVLVFLTPMLPFIVIVMPVFITLSLASLFMTYSLKRNSYGVFFFAGTVLCMTTLLSDVMFSDVYLLGYGTALFSIVGVAFFSATYHSSYIQGQAFNEIVARSLPKSVHHRIWNLVVSGRSLTEMRGAVSGNSLLSVVLIDICDWGKMNDIDHSRIPVGLLRQARTRAFAQFERIMADHGFDLIKTAGDNMTFAGGLFDTVENKELILSSKTLSSVRDLLGEIDPINGELRRLNLPMIKVKVSASMGACDYGLELYNERLQFDIQGHPVNVAYRIESSMDAVFYGNYGKNVALVSSSVVHPCEDLVLRKRFSEGFSFSDKHNMSYECYVGRQYDQELRIEDFAQALFGLYGHVSATSNSGDPEAETENLAESAREKTNHSANRVGGGLGQTDGDLRRARRQKLYVNDGLFVHIDCGTVKTSGRALDISGNGVAIAVPLLEAPDLALNDSVNLSFTIDQQNVSLAAIIVNQSDFVSNGKSYRKFGCRFLDRQRQAAERASRRFPVEASAPPSVSAKDPLDHRRIVRFRCVDLSSSGLGLVTSGTESSLIPGLKLKLSINIPGESNVDVEGEIRYVRACEEEGLIHVGILLTGDLEIFRTAAGAYLVAESDGQLTFREARLCGFLLGGVRKHIRVKYPDIPEEWEQINSLRQSLIGQESEKGSDLPLIDSFDNHSRQIICKVGNRVVACSRIVFNDGNESRIEHLSYGANVPDWLRQQMFVECSRLIVHPEFRGDDVLWAMMEEIGRVTLTSGHRYIVQSCTRSLFPLYQRFGFEELSCFQDGGAEWVLNTLDVERGVAGKVSAGLGWALVLSNLSETMKRRHQYKPGAVESARVRVFDTTRPVVMARYRKHREKALREKNSKELGARERDGSASGDRETGT